ncbi:hypothetical protein GPECTOR_9g607 [Gonium pectorale]|uniref:4-hydroxy-tetrahydrodipicolinate reductase n=1 Tax=Gonium pectorale TaxID=33097 RepID=A0A150GRX9_GONPE|nr:hypothetical protein GPECTOR_9g607 [Gonium pectorale]|eukprot:KXZ52563.1 hypothetical protein GPECTOR_9g607 [Gonium pectorale]
MVNSCTGKMGHEAATAIVSHGFPLIPHTFTGLSSAVAVRARGQNIGVRGVPVSLVGNEKRQAALDSIKEAYPNMMVLDYTLAHCVEDHVRFYAANGLPFVMGTAGGDRRRVHEMVAAAGVYAVLPSPAGEQAASLHALLVSLGAPLPDGVEQFAYEATGRAGDASALDLLNPGAAAEIAAALRSMGVQCEESHVHRMRAARQQRVAGLDPDRDSAAGLHALQGRGMARTCRVTAPGGERSLLLRHYGLDRTAFAVGAVEAARFLAERVAEGAEQRVYDFVDVLRAVQARQVAQRAGAARPAGFQNNVVSAGVVINTTTAVTA